jgi:hypothetical protein
MRKLHKLRKLRKLRNKGAQAALLTRRRVNDVGLSNDGAGLRS